MAELLANGADWQNLTPTFTVHPDGSVVVSFAGAPEGKHPELRFTDAEREAAVKTLAVVPPPPVEPLKLALTADKSGVEVVAAPGPVDFALCSEAGGGNVIYTSETQKLKGLSAGAVVHGEPGHVWVDAHVEGQGEWWSKQHGRIKVEATPPIEPPPPPPPSGFRRGMNAGGWTQSQEVADAKKLGANPTVRLDTPASTAPFTSAGVDVIYLNSGGASTNAPGLHFTEEARAHRAKVQQFGLGHLDPGKLGYSSGGVKSLSTAAVAADAVTVLKKHPDVWAYEYLNEPAGNWFWGNGAESQENATAYCKQIRAIHAALATEGLLRTIFVSADGGHAGENSWLKKMLAADPTLFSDLPEVWPTNHPYDGSGANPNSTLVHWASVEETRRLTGKWPGITEAGRPLESSTGDSPKSTEAQQAAADGAWVRKGREDGCPVVTIYGYRGGNYGIFSSGDTPHPAVAAIAVA